MSVFRSNFVCKHRSFPLLKTLFQYFLLFINYYHEFIDTRNIIKVRLSNRYVKENTYQSVTVNGFYCTLYHWNWHFIWVEDLCRIRTSDFENKQKKAKMWLKVLRQNISHFARRTKGNVYFFKLELRGKLNISCRYRKSIYL